MNSFQDYKYKTARETRIVDLRTGNILEISVNQYDMNTLSANFLDVDGYYTSIDINEDNYKHFPYVSDYMQIPENKAIFTLMFEEFYRLRNNLRNV